MTGLPRDTRLPWGIRRLWSTRARRVAAMILALGMSAGMAGTGRAFWSALSDGGSSGSGGAATVNQGNTPTANAAGQTVTVSWAASTLTTGQAVTGYLVKRYDAVAPFAEQTILSACNGTIAALTCAENSVPTGSWQYTVTPRFATNWLGVESLKSSAVSVSAGETTPPTNAITLSNVSGGAFKSGDTVYYAGTAAGSFTLTNAVADSGSGPASSATATLTGTTTGWTHTPSLVSTPSGGPYVSNAFAWGNNTTSSPSEVVTGRDVDGNTANTTLTFVNDSTAPTTGTVTYIDGSTTASTLSVSFTTGTDGGSGIGTRLLQRASATLTDGVCDVTYSGFTTVTNGTNPTSPVVDAVSAGTCYKYRYLVWDNVGNAATAATSASIAKVTTYAALVGSTTGLVNYHRLGESAGGTGAVSSDSFTGTDGTLLTAHSGELGAATWLQQTGSSYMVVSNGRTRRNTGANSALAVDYVTTQPSTADYSVSADIYNASQLSGDRVGVIARLNTSTSACYVARWEQPNTDWFITKYTSGTSFATLAETNVNAALVVGATYNVRLEVSGTTTTTLKLYVNGVLKLTATDSTSPLTAIGYAGVIDGHTAGQNVKTDTTGKLLDNFLVTEAPDPAAIDSKGTNHGFYMGYATAGGTGAISGDANTAASFDGTNDHLNVARQVSDDFSIEFWFKSTQGIGTGTHWSQGAGLVGTDSSGATAATANDFGVSLRSDGYVVAGVGAVSGGASIVSTTGGYNDGGWHHVVFTRVKATGAMALYVDGSAQGTATGSTASLNVTPIVSIGRLATPGSYFAGSIDEVALYTAALGTTTITEHHNAGV